MGETNSTYQTNNTKIGSIGQVVLFLKKNLLKRLKRKVENVKISQTDD